MSTSRVDLKTGSIQSHLVRLTIPMIWGIAAIVSFQLVDTYYVSLLGTEKLAAMTFTFPVTFFVFTIIMGFGIAMSSVISRLIGEGRENDVKRVTTHGLILSFAIGLAMAVIGYIFRDNIFEDGRGRYGAPDPPIYDHTVFRRAVHGNAARRQFRHTGPTLRPRSLWCRVLSSTLRALFLSSVLRPAAWNCRAAIATVFSNMAAMAAGLLHPAGAQKMLLPVAILQWEKFGDRASGYCSSRCLQV